MIEFTPEQLDAFKDARLMDLSVECWDIFKKAYPWQPENLHMNDEEGHKFIFSQLRLAEHYLESAKDCHDYLEWQIKFAELAFLLKPNFDKDEWISQILTTDIFHPFLRVELLLSALEISINSPEDLKFLENLWRLSLWQPQ